MFIYLLSFQTDALMSRRPRVSALKIIVTIVIIIKEGLVRPELHGDVTLSFTVIVSSRQSAEMH